MNNVLDERVATWPSKDAIGDVVQAWRNWFQMGNSAISDLQKAIQKLPQDVDAKIKCDECPSGYKNLSASGMERSIPIRFRSLVESVGNDLNELFDLIEKQKPQKKPIDEGELADRKWQDNPANPDSPYHEKPIADPDSNEDDAAELRSGLDLTGFELRKERNGFYIIDSESGQKVLGPFKSEGQAEERRNDPALRDDYEAAKSILSKRMGDFSSEKNI